jgi:hypothetical protein
MQPQGHEFLTDSAGKKYGTAVKYGKGKGYRITGRQGPRGGVEVQLYSFSSSALGESGWSVPPRGRFTPGKDPVPIV